MASQRSCSGRRPGLRHLNGSARGRRTQPATGSAYAAHGATSPSPELLFLVCGDPNAPGLATADSPTGKPTHSPAPTTPPSSWPSHNPARPRHLLRERVLDLATHRRRPRPKRRLHLPRAGAEQAAVTDHATASARQVAPHGQLFGDWPHPDHVTATPPSPWPASLRSTGCLLERTDHCA